MRAFYRAIAGAIVGTTVGFLRAIPFLCILACADSPPAIQNVRFKAVFDFRSEDEPPECYALLFVQPASDIALASEITLIHVRSGLTWNITEPVVLENTSGTWVGTPRLAVGSGGFPQGIYVARYTDTSERNAEIRVNLSYPKELAESSAPMAREIVPEASQRQIAVYDADENLLYFGGKKKEWNTISDIKREIGAARFYRECFVEPGYSCVVMLPLCDTDSSEAIDIVPD